MRKAIALLFLLVLVSSSWAQNWFNGTVEQAIAKAQKENKLVLVDFYSGG